MATEKRPGDNDPSESASMGLSQYFKSMIGSLKEVEQSSRIVQQLQGISTEMTRLETHIKDSFASLDGHFQSYTQQIDLLAKMIDFQRRMLRYKTADEAVSAIFQYLEENIGFDEAVIYLRMDSDGDKSLLLSADKSKVDLFKQFLQREKTLQRLKSMIADHELGILHDVDGAREDEVTAPIPWDMLQAASVMLFPLRMQGRLLGFGMLVRQDRTYQPLQLTFANLISGLMTLLLFQHLYFFRVRRRLFKQVNLQKVLEDVKYAEYFDRGPLLVFSLDDGGVILHANNAAQEGLPGHEDTIVGENFFALLPDDRRKAFRELMTRVSHDHLESFKTAVEIEKDGYAVWHLFVTAARLNDRFRMLLVFAVDITAQHYREEIQTRNDVLDHLLHFSRVMNGFLNNLLTVMVPNVSLIRSQVRPEHPLHKHVETMDRSLKKTAALVRKFLNYDLPEIEQPQTMHPNELIETVAETFHKAVQRPIAINLDLSTEVAPFRNFPTRIAKLMQILLANSVEAIEDRGEIHISTRIIPAVDVSLGVAPLPVLSEGDHLEISVRDNGRGLTAEKLHTIFRPFQSDKIKNDSMGLGLFIAYNIVKDLAGEIIVESRPGEMTTFRVYLPTHGATNSRKVIARNGAAAVAHNSGNILVVDDEYNIRTMLKEVLEMHGYIVHTAANGKEGIDIYDRHNANIDLVILDMVMPVMDGKTTFREIKRRKADQKVIVISGYTRREDLSEILTSGALAYMSKPFQIEDIMGKVKSALVS